MKRRGQGGLFKKAGTSRWTIQYFQNGKPIRESTGTANRNMAVKMLNERLAAIGEGKAVGPDVDRTTLRDLAEMITNDYRVNGHKSVAKLPLRLGHLLSFFGADRKAKTITPDAISAYVAHRLAEQHRQGKGAANASVNRELSALRRAMKLASDAGKLAAIPAFSKLKENNARKGFVEPGQLAAICEELPDHLVQVAEAAYITGWRIGELLSREWHHVDLEAGWLRLEPGETKNDEGRMFPLTPELRELLERQLELAKAVEHHTGVAVPWVFFHKNGQRIKSYNSPWNTACKRAGLAGKLVHDFRRTAVRNLERGNISRSVAMKITGHKTESVYRRYAIVAEADMQAAAVKLAALHAGEDRSHPMTPGEIGRLALSASSVPVVAAGGSKK
jgi:integrase